MTGIHPYHLKNYIIRPSQMAIHLWSVDAERLVLGTAAVESQLGHFLMQVGGGPAIGPWQMEPDTHKDLWINYIRYKANLTSRLLRMLGLQRMELETSLPDKWYPSHDRLLHYPLYAAAMCRIHYLRVPHPLPTTVEEDAQYWKDHYNTRLGQGTVRGYMRAWETLVEGRI